MNEEKRCFIYLKTVIVLKSCPHRYKRYCEYCGKRGYHNRCLCLDKFTDDDPNTEPFCAPHFDNIACVGDAGVTVAGNATCPGDRADVKLTVPGDGYVHYKLCHHNQMCYCNLHYNLKMLTVFHTVSWSVRVSSNPILFSSW